MCLATAALAVRAPVLNICQFIVLSFLCVRTFAICRRPSVCLSVCLSVYLSSVTLVHPTQTIKIFGNVFTPVGTLDIC